MIRGKHSYCQFTRLIFWYHCGNWMNYQTSAKTRVSIMLLCTWKCHMIESVIGHGQLYVFIYCLALKLHSTVTLDKRTVSERDGSVWPLLGVACWHRLCTQWWTALSFGLFISWLTGASKKSVSVSYINR